MLSQGFIQSVVNGLVIFATDLLMPLMILTFSVGIVLRLLNYHTLKREEFFANEFQKRIDAFMDAVSDEKNLSFFVMTKKLLLITYYELYEVAALLQRRKPDTIMSWSDRVFLTKSGFAWLVKDILKQIRYIKHGSHRPPLLEVSKNSFQVNPCFTKIFGWLPSGSVNEFTNILPGMFIVGGIFGTFLGIMKALPELGGMNLEDIEGTKLIMDQFLLKISFSMSTSIVGIVLSISMSIINTAFSAERLFMRTIEKFESALYELWNRSDNNSLPLEGLSFDEHKNPLEALAEKALNNEVKKMRNRLYKNPKGPVKEPVSEQHVA